MVLLRHDSFFSAILHHSTKRIILDEAQVALDGGEFRHSILRLQENIASAKVQTIMLSATIPPTLEQTLLQVMLLLPHTQVVRTTTARPDVGIHLVRLPYNSCFTPCNVAVALANGCQSLLGSRHRILVLVSSVEEGEEVSKALSCAFVHAKIANDVKQQLVQSWEDGQAGRILVATSVLTQGYHLPSLAVVINIQPYGVTPLIQSLGRIRGEGHTFVVLSRPPASPSTKVDADGRAALREWYMSTTGCLRLGLWKYADGSGLACADLDNTMQCSRCARAGNQFNGVQKLIDAAKSGRRLDNLKVQASVRDWYEMQVSHLAPQSGQLCGIGPSKPSVNSKGAVVKRKPLYNVRSSQSNRPFSDREPSSSLLSASSRSSLSSPGGSSAQEKADMIPRTLMPSGFTSASRVAALIHDAKRHSSTGEHRAVGVDVELCVNLSRVFPVVRGASSRARSMSSGDALVGDTSLGSPSAGVYGCAGWPQQPTQTRSMSAQIPPVPTTDRAPSPMIRSGVAGGRQGSTPIASQAATDHSDAYLWEQVERDLSEADIVQVLSSSEFDDKRPATAPLRHVNSSASYEASATSTDPASLPTPASSWGHPTVLGQVWATQQHQIKRLEKLGTMDNLLVYGAHSCAICFILRNARVGAHKDKFDTCTDDLPPINFTAFKEFKSGLKIPGRQEYCYRCGVSQQYELEPAAHLAAHAETGGKQAAGKGGSCPWFGLVPEIVWAVTHNQYWREKVRQAFPDMPDCTNLREFRCWYAFEPFLQGRFYNGLEVALWVWDNVLQ